MAEILKRIQESILGTFPQLDSGVKRATRSPADIYVQGLLSRMETHGETVDEAYAHFVSDIRSTNGREHLGPLRTAYKSLKK